MSVTGNQRSTIQMYSDARAMSWEGLCSHRVRVVLSEKDVIAEVVEIAEGEVSDDLLQHNPQGFCPTLVDRGLALYDASVIIGYLDERYPHPPFMPIDPVSRARTRLALYRIESDWYSLLPNFPYQTKTADEARELLSDSLVAANDVFAAMPFFLSEEYSILDAALAPLLWRLPAYGIVLPDSADAVSQYSKKLFARPGFIASLSNQERDMKK